MSTFRARIQKPTSDVITYTLRTGNSGKARQEAGGLASPGDRIDLDIYDLHKSAWRPFLVREAGATDWTTPT